MSDETHIDVLLEGVREAKRAVSDEGRPEAVEKQHAQDKLTARERVDYLCDDFDVIGQLAAPSPSLPPISRLKAAQSATPADRN
ncbi:MAG: acetyl-CoA carboxylase carboxyltransferase component [Natronomonas sp.]|jgi:acetyl-CoA carboxylase carboxyltransferase component|uniref:hypothetical protein n=1 Tax=Natronomonas sp. TaxID=2184060 RepID=UPI003989E5E0